MARGNFTEREEMSDKEFREAVVEYLNNYSEPDNLFEIPTSLEVARFGYEYRQKEIDELKAQAEKLANEVKLTIDRYCKIKIEDKSYMPDFSFGTAPNTFVKLPTLSKEIFPKEFNFEQLKEKIENKGIDLEYEMLRICAAMIIALKDWEEFNNKGE